MISGRKSEQRVKDALWLKYIPHSFHVASCKYTCIAQLSFTRIARGIGTVASRGSEKEEIKEGEEEEEEEEEEGEEEDMFDKEAELGLVMSKDFCVSEEGSVAEDEGVNGFGGVPTRTEGADNCVCGKGEKLGGNY
ncbi:uncharacterized protein MONOS_477 [Monocercomonoides exilis]|uniref:uncharacterized protein n=1 Tax=Monocercomonoides exilis TaxID=2049356 RepID=UPI00355A188C|nr:hypothetical protein MONOS_477 [Monocercomonoides exilis]|eukprot:MONOS_477.1-p1 / transcript=MONOS_477.1 / gene=MONOS_477 / organism=Monocercomonoides_exilis_PA203 / gene_product=unspecified product / transcript_product=unspecified product / location=Mono_scaffold00007:240039-240618(+) / protein_length=136 / sequence_SO=supercontig / SO=protein_coding / is_pseudo=false